jgi:membrane-associated phospholipid phosphatase
MKSFISNNRFQLGLYAFLILTASYFMFMYEKHAIHLYVNGYVGNRYVNAFFYTTDHIGDGFMAPVFIACIFAVNVRAGVYTTTTLLLASAMSTILKYYFFDDAQRPHFVFQNFDIHQLNLVEGVQMNINNSFPSGHATQGFSIFMSLGFFVRRHWYKVLAVMIAAIGAFSRVYLSQHWLIDIVAGSLIGTFWSMVMYYFFIYRNVLPRLDKPVQDLFRKAQT